MDKNEKISIEVDKKQKYDFCKSVHNLRKFCLIDCHVREKEAIECDIYTWILKKINCDSNIDKFDDY